MGIELASRGFRRRCLLVYLVLPFRRPTLQPARSSVDQPLLILGSPPGCRAAGSRKASWGARLETSTSQGADGRAGRAFGSKRPGLPGPIPEPRRGMGLPAWIPFGDGARRGSPCGPGPGLTRYLPARPDDHSHLVLFRGWKCLAASVLFASVRLADLGVAWGHPAAHDCFPLWWDDLLPNRIDWRAGALGFCGVREGAKSPSASPRDSR